jgi:hypothetical protein
MWRAERRQVPHSFRPIGEEPASRGRYDVRAMNQLLARDPMDAWAATISKQNG